MDTLHVTVTEYCSYHQQIDPPFIYALAEAGLIQVHREENDELLSTDELNALEKYARLHYDLDINMPGIEAISHLLGRLELLQQEISRLRGQVNFLDSAPTFRPE